MIAKLIVKKIGNHWYPSIPHKLGIDDISLCETAERFLNYISKGDEQFEILFRSEHSIYNDKHILDFDNHHVYMVKEENIKKIWMKYYINNSMFVINEQLFTILENYLNLDFVNNYYQLEILVT